MVVLPSERNTVVSSVDDLQVLLLTLLALLQVDYCRRQSQKLQLSVTAQVNLHRRVQHIIKHLL